MLQDTRGRPAPGEMIWKSRQEVETVVGRIAGSLGVQGRAPDKGGAREGRQALGGFHGDAWLEFGPNQILETFEEQAVLGHQPAVLPEPGKGARPFRYQVLPCSQGRGGQSSGAICLRYDRLPPQLPQAPARQEKQ